MKFINNFINESGRYLKLWSLIHRYNEPHPKPYIATRFGTRCFPDPPTPLCPLVAHLSWFFYSLAFIPTFISAPSTFSSLRMPGSG